VWLCHSYFLRPFFSAALQHFFISKRLFFFFGRSGLVGLFLDCKSGFFPLYGLQKGTATIQPITQRRTEPKSHKEKQAVSYSTITNKK